MKLHILLLLSLTMNLQTSAQTLPPDSEYVIVDENGHLSVNGERRRFWAVIGKLMISAGVQADDDAETRAAKLERSRKGTLALLDRFQALGFNGLRMWYSLGGAAHSDYEMGDGSYADSVDFMIAEAKKRGFRIWFAGFGNRVGLPDPEKVNLVDDPETAGAWVEAVEDYLGREKKVDMRHSFARHWDPRLEALYIERMKENADHVNQYTGLRWGDDPVFAVWELSNEEWFMSRMLGGIWQKEPAFFRARLIAKWNAWLLKKYGSDEALAEAWGGVLAGERPSEGSVLLAPMRGKSDPSLAIGDANPAALAALTSEDQRYSRADFSDERAGDVLEFFLSIQLSHKKRCEAAVKTFGKSLALSPLIYDTGIGYEIHSQFIHQNADAVAHDAYVNGWGPRLVEPDLENARTENRKMLAILDKERISANDGPWVNWLLKPPGISQGVPWLEHNRTEGKPFLVYETQIQQPAKYRADFPLRLAALASIQDWDWISWHYFASHDDVGIVEEPFHRPMDVTSGSHPQGYHYTYDEVQGAMMRQAALIWRNELLEPAPNPTTFIYGRQALRDADSMDYAGSYGTVGFDMLQTTYQYGVRIQIDPGREDNEVIGPVVSFADRNTHNPYTPTPAITIDWKKGTYKFDNDKVAAFTGMMANVGDEIRFDNGVVLKDVAHHNPEGIYAPINEDSKYLAFALNSEDGKILADSERVSLALQSTSFNSGFEMDPELILEKGHPRHAKTKQGGLPVLVVRVEATVVAPALDRMTATFFDWHNQPIGETRVENGQFRITADLPITYIILTR
ncbi:MAG: hypothetical protein WD708_08010 [Kiritimatiellia bacterium]